jgi:hypothetical protein
MEQIIACVSRESEFGEEDEDRLAIYRLAHESERLIRIVGGVRDAHRRNSHGNAHEVVIVEVVELCSRFHVTAFFQKP